MHEGHRARMKERFIKEGLDNFAQHNVLELLLFYAIPQRDTNTLAHELINTFGSLAGVFEASVPDLCKVKGVGENTAVLLSLIPQMCRVYNDQKNADGVILNGSEKAGGYLLSKYMGIKYELVTLILLDNKCRVLSFSKIAQGSVNSTEVNIRRMVEEIIKYNATAAIMAHNHPGGIAVPSREDIESTRMVIKTLRMINVTLRDHIIIADNDFISFADSNSLAGLFT